MLKSQNNKIVALHGQVGMAADWGDLSKLISSHGYEIDAVDLWSYLDGGELELEQFGMKLNEEYGEGHILMGYSMGGRLALHALIDRASKWRGAVIISAHTGLESGLRSERRSEDDGWAEMAGNLPWGEFLKLWNKQGVLGNDVMPCRSKLEEMSGKIASSFRCWSLAEQEDLLDKLSSVDIPVLWVVGEDDEKFTNVGVVADDRLENVQLMVVPKAGHRVPWEAEDTLVSGVVNWIKSEL